MEKLKRLLESRKATYVERTPNDIYRNVAHDTDLTPGEVAAIGGLESQHGKYDSPIQGGSAKGLFQFQPATAEHLEEGSSSNLHDLDTQASLMKKYLNQNQVDNAPDAFAKHNLGPSRGKKFINASDDTHISTVIPARVIKANPGLYNVKTVGEAKEKIKQKLNEGKESSDILPNFMDLFKGNK